VTQLLHILKLPTMLLIAVGGVWVAAWERTLPDLTKRHVVLPATDEAKHLTESIRREALDRGEVIADTSDLYQ
jgi:hypothetical protein